MTRGRLEAFSDGVFAIIVTLLVLDLKTPDQGETIFHAVGRQAPQLAVYAITFLMVGVTWINHHAMFRSLKQPDKFITVANLFLLMVLAILPFAASLAAQGLEQGGNAAKQALFIYTLDFLLAAVAFSTIWFWATQEHRDVLDSDIDPVAARKQLPGFGFGVIVYVVLCAVAFIAPWVVAVGHLAVAGYYLNDQLSEDRIRKHV